MAPNLLEEAGCTTYVCGPVYRSAVMTEPTHCISRTFPTAMFSARRSRYTALLIQGSYGTARRTRPHGLDGSGACASAPIVPVVGRGAPLPHLFPHTAEKSFWADSLTSFPIRLALMFTPPVPCFTVLAATVFSDRGFRRTWITFIRASDQRQQAPNSVSRRCPTTQTASPHR